MYLQGGHFWARRFPRLIARKCQDKEILAGSPSTQWWSVVASSQYWAPDLFRPRFYVFFVGLAAASAATTPPLPWGLDPTGRHNGGSPRPPIFTPPWHDVVTHPPPAQCAGLLGFGGGGLSCLNWPSGDRDSTPDKLYGNPTRRPPPPPLMPPLLNDFAESLFISRRCQIRLAGRDEVQKCSKVGILYFLAYQNC